MKYSLLIVSLLFIVSCSQISLVSLDKPELDSQQLRVSWVKNLDPVYNTGNLPIGTSSPYLSEDILYMGSLKGEMTAYEFDTGRVIWQTNDKHSLNAMANRLGKNIYYGSKNGRLFSRHYLTGKLNYSIDLGAPIESQPIFSRGRLLIHLRNHTIICLDASTGKVFWRYKRSIPYSTTLQRVSKVLPYGRQLIVGFADGNIASISLEEGVVNWEQKISTGVKFVDVDVRPFIFNKKIVVGSASGPMRFLNLKNGVIERTVEFPQSHTPILDNNQLIVGSTFGDLYRVDKYAKVVKRVKLSKNAISSVLAYKDGFVVATMGSEIFYLDKDFNHLGDFNLGSEQSAIFGELVGSKDSFSFYSSRNRLYVVQ
jgi:outer membrane protein assembly factor BamB